MLTNLLALEPAGLSAAEKQVIKSYGGWTYFMMAFALKPWEDDDVQEGLRILRGFARASGSDYS